MDETVLCGKIGIASPTPVFDCGWLAFGRDAMRHRGPDDAGEWWSPKATLHGVGSCGREARYYMLVRRSNRIASELKGLMADPDLPRRINPEALDCCLHKGFVPGDRCLLEGVKRSPTNARRWLRAASSG